MEYKVVLTSQAKIHFRQVIDYLMNELESAQAATSVADDFIQTKQRLAQVAGSLKLCDNEILRAKGYRTIRFSKHRYLMVYKVEADTAYVVGIYHDLQDYEKTLS